MTKLPFVGLLLVLSAGCVSSGAYEKAVAVNAACEARERKLNERERATVAALARTTEELAGAQDARAAAENAVSALDTKVRDLEARVAELRADLAGKTGELVRFRAAKLTADARAALYQDLLKRFRKMVDAGELAVVVRDGRMVLQLSNDVLFDAGKKELKPAGKTALESVAAVLKSIEHRHFQVAGHTDDQPIKLSPYKSNWELSSARALEVVRFLVKHGMKPDVLSAAGYGEYDPVADGKSNPARTKNRRIEITVVPELDELVTVPIK